MNIRQVLSELDNMFINRQTASVEQFLSGKLREAEDANDVSAMITLMNELIGYYRDISRFHDCLHYCEKAIKLMDEVGLSGTEHYAMMLLNTANAQRAAGNHTRSLEHYMSAYLILEKSVAANDLRFAGFYNNLSLLYQDMKPV